MSTWTQEQRAEAGRRALRRSGYYVPSSPSAPRRPQAAPRRSASEDKAVAYCLADLRASADGCRLGRQFAHDPYALARSLGVAVEHVPVAQLQRPGRPLITITGGLWRIPGQPPVVQLAHELDGREADRVLAHEIGHFLNLPGEKLCDQFAAAFLKVDDDELPGHAWRQIQAELLRRARGRP